MVWEEKELQEWAEDPESFFCAQLMDRDDCFVLRNAAERLVLGLLDLHPAQVTSFLIAKLGDLDSQARISSLPAVSDAELLHWDALYHCAGICVAPLTQTGRFDCTSWLQSVLGPILQNLTSQPDAAVHSSGQQQILRVRMLRLMAVWMDSLSPSVLPHIAAFLTSMLSAQGNGNGSSSEIVVRLYTAKAVEALLLCKRCSLKTVLPQLHGLSVLLLDLVAEVVDFEVRRWLLSVAGELVFLARGSDVRELDLRPVLAGALNLWTRSVAQLQQAPFADLKAPAPCANGSPKRHKKPSEKDHILVPAMLEVRNLLNDFSSLLSHL